MENDFIIPLNELVQGRNEFGWAVGTDFFHRYGNNEIKGANLNVSAAVEKNGRSTKIDCRIEGTVSAPCDRCLADLTFDIDTEIKLSLKYESEASDGVNEGEREIVCIPENASDFDFSQIIYDYSCLSIPMQRVHPYDECDPEMLKYLEPKSAVEPDRNEKENPFSILKNLI